ncbi:hypothetical protein MNBD_GAMMA12-2975 [hydrothermal vent metagenome]|uniref:GumN family protein n=1 Tax=hydrothermal vent metagenome TaxID=652676 RepID=A0A3B0XWQ0_9ZZZZ
MHIKNLIMALQLGVLAIVLSACADASDSSSQSKHKSLSEVKALPGSAPEPKQLKVPDKIEEVSGKVIAQVIPSQQKFKKGLYWKIERPGYKPSYLFGTMHSPHPDVIALTKVIKKEFDRSAILCTEIKTGLSMMKEMAKLRHLITYPRGESLQKTLGKDLFDKISKQAKTLGMGVTALDRMRPWVVTVTLGQPKSTGALALDLQLALNASKQGKILCGLEKVHEQLAALAGASKENSIRDLRLTSMNFEKVRAMVDTLRTMYLSGDLLAMSNMIKNSVVPVPKVDLEKMIFRLVIRRNIIMVNRMQPYLKKGNVFFAVGALHLPGKGGLLRLLESQGYRLTRLH